MTVGQILHILAGNIYMFIIIIMPLFLREKRLNIWIYKVGKWTTLHFMQIVRNSQPELCCLPLQTYRVSEL